MQTFVTYVPFPNKVSYQLVYAFSHLIRNGKKIHYIGRKGFQNTINQNDLPSNDKY